MGPCDQELTNRCTEPTKVDVSSNKDRNRAFLTKETPRLLICLAHFTISCGHVTMGLHNGMGSQPVVCVLRAVCCVLVPARRYVLRVLRFTGDSSPHA